ncbi:MAG: tetratricopeptide repeat protein [Solirubrobacterales bacterium]
MRRIFASLVLVLLLGASSSCSTDPAPRAEARGLDALFQRLQTTESPEEAQAIEVTIRHVWSQSGRRAIDSQMLRAVEAVHAGDYDRALETLNGIVAIAPEFVEGWNLRATVHFLREEYAPAVSDIEHVLALEPRHFGALAGLGRIFLELDDKKAAMTAFEMALAINPYLGDVRKEMDALREELAGIPI